jgi:hypothetical protein
MKKIWIVATVKRGFIQEPEIFYDSNAAQNRKKILMRDFNPDYDELEVFEKILPIGMSA